MDDAEYGHASQVLTNVPIRAPFRVETEMAQLFKENEKPSARLRFEHEKLNRPNEQAPNAATYRLYGGNGL